MDNMKHMGKIIGLVFLLVVGFAISPATGNTFEAANNTFKSVEYTEIEFWDCTDTIPIKTTIKLPTLEWNAIKNELQQAMQENSLLEERIAKQMKILQSHDITLNDGDINVIKSRFFTQSLKYQDKLPATTPILNNSIINAMCAINFELSNGTTLVLGLNSFVNYIGFDIISFHKGYSPSGIEARGLVQQQTTPGEFFGFTFGFLGYWYGEKTSTGVYSSVSCAGFSVLTAWIPLPIIP